MLTRQWSSSEIQQSFGQCQSLKDLIAAVEKTMWSEGQVICEIHVNGRRLTDGEEAAATQPLTDIQTLRVGTEEPKDLMMKTVADVIGMLPAFQDKCCAAAEKFRFSSVSSAQESFAEVIEICRYMTDVMFVIKNQFPSQVQPHVENEYRKVVSEILSAFEQADLALLADTLEYSLTNVLGQFQKQLTELQPSLAYLCDPK